MESDPLELLVFLSLRLLCLPDEAPVSFFVLFLDDSVRLLVEETDDEDVLLLEV